MGLDMYAYEVDGNVVHKIAPSFDGGEMLLWQNREVNDWMRGLIMSREGVGVDDLCPDFFLWLERADIDALEAALLAGEIEADFESIIFIFNARRAFTKGWLVYYESTS